jgi:hypothetical protein
MPPRILPILAAAALGACGAAYDSVRYDTARPITTVRGEQGAVKLASEGVIDLRVSGNVMPAIHVRMLVDDTDGRTFAVDTGDVQVRVPGGFGSGPMFVETGIRGPTISTAPGEERVIDLYFPLPRGVVTNDYLTSFDVVWSLRTPSQTLHRRTHFERA